MADDAAAIGEVVAVAAVAVSDLTRALNEGI